jgi:hypothetical protein
VRARRREEITALEAGNIRPATTFLLFNYFVSCQITEFSCGAGPIGRTIRTLSGHCSVFKRQLQIPFKLSGLMRHGKKEDWELSVNMHFCS